MSVLLCVAAYFAVGALTARLDMPRLWTKARNTWGYTDSARADVMLFTTLTFFLWPFRFPLVAFAAIVGRAVDSRDPENLRQKVQDQRREIQDRERRIAELEHDLGIGRRR